MSRSVVVRRRQVLAGAIALVALVVLVVSLGRGGSAPDDAPAAADPSPRTGTAPEEQAPAVVPEEVTPPPPEEVAPAPEPPSPDRLAGVLAPDVAESGTGERVTVPGEQPAPEGADEVLTLRVQVEEGLPVDGAAFAATAMTALQDERGWAGKGWSFARTESGDDADADLVLASPDLTDELCAPLRTGGELSCRNGDDVVLNWSRWVQGAEAYGEDRVGYRTYLVNHEVGHALGHGHVSCPGEGEPAPVMLQQTISLDGCAPNPWPNP